jgi:hypothetical protein
MKVKANEAQGLVLDWMVTKTIPGLHEGHLNPVAFRKSHDEHDFNYSTKWSQGGPIIGRKEIMFHAGEGRTVVAYLRSQGTSGVQGVGNDHLTSAMRCHVVSELGNEVEVPNELA